MHVSKLGAGPAFASLAAGPFVGLLTHTALSIAWDILPGGHALHPLTMYGSSLFPLRSTMFLRLADMRQGVLATRSPG